MFHFVLGSRNPKKLSEVRRLVDPARIRVDSLEQIPSAVEIEETGSTFAENARLKAVQQAVNLRRWVLGEDSGLSVDALQGRPGVYSARYSGDGATDEANNRKLLDEMADVPDDHRGAHYTSQLCLADPQGRVVFEATGECAGIILSQPRGREGFGYDPLFLIPEYHRTFAELGPMTKAAISHRARAMRQFLRMLEHLDGR